MTHFFGKYYPFTCEAVKETIYQGRVSSTVYKIVELDKFKEHPIMYLITANHFNVLIDTGCGTGDLREYLGLTFKEQLDSRELYIINTHNHFEHVGGNMYFSTTTGKLANGVRDLCASAYSPQVTMDMHETMAFMHNMAVRQYFPTRWLQEHEKIYLGKEEDNYLEVLLSPGHTADCLCLWYPADQRMFVGDFIYRWKHILAVSPHTTLELYYKSCKRLVFFLKKQPDPQNIRLSCGHVDSSLPWSPTLEDFMHLIKSVIKGQAQSRPVTGRIEGKIYESRDFSLRLLVGTVPEMERRRMLEASEKDRKKHRDIGPDNYRLLKHKHYISFPESIYDEDISIHSLTTLDRQAIDAGVLVEEMQEKVSSKKTPSVKPSQPAGSRKSGSKVGFDTRTSLEVDIDHARQQRQLKMHQQQLKKKEQTTFAAIVGEAGNADEIPEEEEPPAPPKSKSGESRRSRKESLDSLIQHATKVNQIA